MGEREHTSKRERNGSFAEYRLFYRALLQKRPIILGSLLIVATPETARMGGKEKSEKKDRMPKGKRGSGNVKGKGKR